MVKHEGDQEVQYPSPLRQYQVAIPEPATLVLLGLGKIGPRN